MSETFLPPSLTHLQEAIQSGHVTWRGAPDLIAQFRRRGSLSPKQFDLVDKLVREARERVARAARPQISFASIIERLTAVGPTARVAWIGEDQLTYRLNVARSTSRNAGGLYLKIDGTYAGKITPEGRFFPAWGFTGSEGAGDVEQELVRLSGNLEELVTTYGKVTGSCSICGRELTDESSISRGIGPVCATKFLCEAA